MRRAGHDYRDQAVLCTGNEKLSTLGQELERLGIPVLFLGSLFDRPEVKDLIAFLSILSDRRAMGLIRVACWPEFASAISDVAAVFDHLRGEAGEPGAWRHDLSAIGVSEQGQTALAALAAALQGFRPKRPALARARNSVARSDAHRRPNRRAADVASRARGIAIWQLMNFLRSQPTGPGLAIPRLLNRMRRLMRLRDDRDLRQLPAAAQGIDAVRLMTIHGAKGLEFAVVHMPGMNADSMPRTPSAPQCLPPDGMIEGGKSNALELFRAGHAEEQECLFYVALSRARDRLFIYAPTQKSNGYNRPLSPFLDRLGPGLVRQQVTPSDSLPPAPDAADVKLFIDGDLCFTGPQIALYEKCRRRFFYTHIMQTGGRRTTTSSSCKCMRRSEPSLKP